MKPAAGESDLTSRLEAWRRAAAEVQCLRLASRPACGSGKYRDRQMGGGQVGSARDVLVVGGGPVAVELAGEVRGA